MRGKNNTDDEISAFNTAKANLIDGQPLFDKKNNYLYIGNKDDSSSIKPITSDRIKGDGYSIAIGSASPRNLEINTTSNIKMQAGSGSSNPLVIETSYTDNLVKIKKSNDDTTKSTA